MTNHSDDPFWNRRKEMVALLRQRGIVDPKVLSAFSCVRREMFVPEEFREYAYEDAPLPIGCEQTISQPYVVAIMAEAAKLSEQDRVLEIGTGSGYAAAIFALVAAEVFTVERIESLALLATERLRQHGFGNTHVLQSDGTLGWTENGPYDAIIASAGGPRAPQALIDQLAPGGRLVIPIGDSQMRQRLMRYIKDEKGISAEDLGDVRFVPLIGSQGWPVPNNLS